MIIEWTHRWVAALVGILALATAIAAWREHRKNKDIWAPAIAAVVVIGVQAWVGRLVVKGDLDADLVSVHLAISMTVVGLLTLVVTRAAFVTKSDKGKDLLWRGQLAVGSAIALLILLLGSYVHNLYISGWPLVADTLTPDLSNRYVLVHFLHRSLAGLGFVYMIYLARSARSRQGPKVQRLLIYGAAMAYTLNVLLGAAHVFTQVQSSILVALHLLLAALVWSSLLAAAALTSRIALSSSRPK